MIVKSSKPMKISEVVNLTGKDALYTIDGVVTRIMNLSEGQSVEVEKVAFCDGRKWGLKPVAEGKKYKYISFLCD